MTITNPDLIKQLLIESESFREYAANIILTNNKSFEWLKQEVKKLDSAVQKIKFIRNNFVREMISSVPHKILYEEGSNPVFARDGGLGLQAARRLQVYLDNL